MHRSLPGQISLTFSQTKKNMFDNFNKIYRGNSAKLDSAMVAAEREQKRICTVAEHSHCHKTWSL